jgi:hypothetical protein
VKKKLIKPIKILKKQTGSVWFWFYKPETEKPKQTQTRKKTESNRKKTEPNRKKTEPKSSQTSLNRFFPKNSNRTETGRFEPVSVFLK